jgi:pyridoxine 5-phosphate synthase
MGEKSKLKLGVNVDHVATLRQARGTAYPDPQEAVRLCAEAGAHGVTLHLREDRRHIQDRDVVAIRRRRLLPLNLEMSIHPESVRVALRVRPDEACLVPERRREVTTEGGLDVAGQFRRVRPVVEALRDAGVVVSLFIGAERRQIEAAARLGAPCVELHTGAYADAPPARRRRELDRLIEGAGRAHQLGLQVNAGHGINLLNIRGILQIPHLDTLNIGHSIVARAVLVGMKQAVREMLSAMAGYRGGRRERRV